MIAARTLSVNVYFFTSPSFRELLCLPWIFNCRIQDYCRVYVARLNLGRSLDFGLG